MFENIINFFKKAKNKEEKQMANSKSKSAAKERLHLVLMQDRANVSADFLELMKQEIIEVIKKYIDVDEEAIDVRLTNQSNDDGTNGAPALYANIPIMNIKNDVSKTAKEVKEKKEIIKKDKEEKVEKEETVKKEDTKKTSKSSKSNSKKEKKQKETNTKKEEKENIEIEQEENLKKDVEVENK